MPNDQFENVTASLAARLVAQETRKVDYCAKKFTYLNLAGFVAVGAILYAHWVKDILDAGSPPTFLGFSASERLIFACPTAAALELVGFFALNSDITSVMFAMAYLFAVTRGIYDGAFVVSRAWSSEHDNFNQIVEFASFYYHNISRRKLPAMIDTYQRKNKCCAWGKFHWMKWAKELNTTDLPDSCCRVYRPDCGKGIIPRRPSGYLSFIQAGSAVELTDILTRMNQKFGMNRWDTKNNEIKRYWKRLFPDRDRDTFDIWNPTTVVPSWYLRLIDEEFAEDYENLKNTTDKNIAILIGRDSGTTAGQQQRDATALIYFTQGLEEHYRIQSVVHDKPCELTRNPRRNYKLPDKFRNVGPEDVNMLSEMRKIIMPVRFYGIGLTVVYLLMFLVFFHYFQNIKACQLALDNIPVDFQETAVTTTGFMRTPLHYLQHEVYETLDETNENRRRVSVQGREELENRYNLIIGLHKLGIILKEQKIKQPRAPKPPDDPADIDRYQIQMLARLPPRFYPAMVDRFTQEPHASIGARSPINPGYQGGLKPEFNGVPPRLHRAHGATGLNIPGVSSSSEANRHRKVPSAIGRPATAPNLSKKSKKSKKL